MAVDPTLVETFDIGDTKHFAAIDAASAETAAGQYVADFLPLFGMPDQWIVCAVRQGRNDWGQMVWAVTVYPKH